MNGHAPGMVAEARAAGDGAHQRALRGGDGHGDVAVGVDALDHDGARQADGDLDRAYVVLDVACQRLGIQDGAVDMIQARSRDAAGPVQPRIHGLAAVVLAPGERRHALDVVLPGDLDLRLHGEELHYLPQALRRGLVGNEDPQDDALGGVVVAYLGDAESLDGEFRRGPPYVHQGNHIALLRHDFPVGDDAEAVLGNVGDDARVGLAVDDEERVGLASLVIVAARVAPAGLGFVFRRHVYHPAI